MVALLSTALGLVGIVVPGLPTVPFVLLAAWAASKGWPAFEQWLITHPTLGPPIIQWRQQGAVSRPAKWLASIMMSISVIILFVSAAPPLIKWLVPLGLMGVGWWLWQRPESPSIAKNNSRSNTLDKK